MKKREKVAGMQCILGVASMPLGENLAWNRMETSCFDAVGRENPLHEVGGEDSLDELGTPHDIRRSWLPVVGPTESIEGDTAPIITVWQSPMNESRSTSVSLEPRKGMCVLPWSRPRMHSFNASNDLLISAPCT